MRWKRWKWLSWVLLVPLVYWLSPYLLGSVLGGLYAGFAIPIYSQVCLGNPLAFLELKRYPLASKDYQVFLLGRGCNLQEVGEKEKKAEEEAQKECGGAYTGDPIADANRSLCIRLRSIDSSYRGMHPWFNDDLIGRLVDYQSNLFTDHFRWNFFPTMLDVSNRLVLNLNKYILFRALYCIFYACLVAFLGYLLSNFAQDVYICLKRVLSN